MSNGIIVRPIPLTPAQVTGNFSMGTDAAFPIANLVDPQPKVVWRSNPVPGAAWGLVIDIDLYLNTFIDTVALLFTNAGPDSSWFVSGTTNDQGTGQLDNPASYMFGAAGGAAYTPFGAPSTTGNPTRHGVLTGAAKGVRHLRIYFQDDAAGGRGGLPFRAGVVVVGQRWLCELPFANFELGSGRKIVDLSDKRQLPGGEVGRWPKAKVPAWRATWSNMTDADLRALWSIVSSIGLSEPFLFVEDPDVTAGLNERIHYATIDALDYYERAQVDKSKIELKATDWL